MTKSCSTAGIKNQSAIKALDIIEFLANGNNEPRRLHDIAEGLSMNASTVSRFLTSLVECGYVHQDPTISRYFLSMKLCSVANKVSSNMHLYDISLPIMKDISATVQESVCMAIEQDSTVVYIGAVQGPDQILRTMQRIGSRAPLHCTGVGKLLLCNYTDEEIHKLVAEKGLPIFTKNTISTEERLLKELAEIKRNGYAFDNEECEIGARCIAMPIMDYTHRIIAGISITGPIFRLTDEHMKEIIPYFSEQAKLLSQKLGKTD